MTAMLSTIAEIIRDLLIFVAVIAALLIALVVVVSKMPDTNPLKRILTALSYRLGATLAAGALAIPLEPIPGIDVLYDIGIPIVLIWYWFTFSRMPSAGRLTRPRQIKGKLSLDKPPGGESPSGRRSFNNGVGVLRGRSLYRYSSKADIH
jgi:hypothetical protein